MQYMLYRFVYTEHKAVGKLGLA